MRRLKANLSIRTAMIVLACVSIAAALAIAILAAWASYRENRQRVESSLIAATRAVMLSVDSELDQALAFVNGFSRSASLRSGDFVRFQKLATDALAPHHYLLVVKSADGAQEYVNTSHTPPELHSVTTNGGLLWIWYYTHSGDLSERAV